MSPAPHLAVAMCSLVVSEMSEERNRLKTFKITGPALTALLLSTGALLCASPASAGTLPTLYTAAQASAGAQAYTQNCAMCHGDDLNGGAGPALKGQSFAPPGASRTVGSVFTMVAEQMPATQPGSLSKTQYEDIMAYILQQNDYPAGTSPLVYKDALNSTTPVVTTAK